MKILIVEPNGNGHHMALYVSHVVQRLVDEKCDVSLLTTRLAVEHPSFKSLQGYQEKINIYYLPELPLKDGNSAWKLFLQQTKCWLTLRREFKKIQSQFDFNIIYMPTVDWLAKAMEVFGSPFSSTSFVALYMSPKHHRKSMGLGPASRHDWLYKKMFQRLLRIPTLRSVLVIDEFFQDYCKEQYGLLAQKVEYVPDFGKIRGVGTKEECRAKIGISCKSKLLLVYGSLTKRKGIMQLIEALDRPDSPKDLKVVLAGRASEDMDSFIASAVMQKMIKEKRIFLRLYFHDDLDEFCIFKAADYVWLGYTDGFYGSSAVLYQALHAGLAVIAMEQGLIGKIVRKYRLGVTVNPSRQDSILQGLNQIVLSQFTHTTDELFLLKEFVNMHTPEVHSTVVFNALLKGKI